MLRLDFVKRMRSKSALAVLFICLIVGVGGSIYALRQGANPSQKPKEEAAKTGRATPLHPRDAETVAPPAASNPAPATDPVVVSAPVRSTPVSAPQQPVAIPPRVQQDPAPQVSLCNQKRSDFYVAHTAAINQEYQTHQQNLAVLEQHYDAGDYFVSSDAQASEDYQEDVAEENERWHQAGAVIDADYANQLASVGCPAF